MEIVSEDPGQCSDHRQKVTGLKSESVTGIIPESWPASFRTTARDDFELVAAFRRNPQQVLFRAKEGFHFLFMMNYNSPPWYSRIEVVLPAG